MTQFHSQWLSSFRITKRYSRLSFSRIPPLFLLAQLLVNTQKGHGPKVQVGQFDFLNGWCICFAKAEQPTVTASIQYGCKSVMCWHMHLFYVCYGGTFPYRQPEKNRLGHACQFNCAEVDDNAYIIKSKKISCVLSEETIFIEHFGILGESDHSTLYGKKVPLPFTI